MMREPRPRRKRGWLFGKRGNRRVRPPSHPDLPVPEKVEKPTRARIARRWLVFGGLVLLLAGAAAGGVWFFTHSSHFAVRGLRFSPTRHVSGESLQARAGVVVGQNLFAVSLDEVARDVLAEPWIAKAKARRELPGTISVEVIERQPVCVISLGALYLADGEGRVFKRATPDEAAGLPVVTGVERDEYLDQPDHTRARVRDALIVVSRWNERAARPPIGEVHSDARLGVTVYTSAGVGVRLGRVDESLGERLARLDAVWSELERTGERPRFIYLDNRARPDRVTVKLAAPRPSGATQKSET